MISSLQKLVGIGSDIGHTSSSSIPFNAALPISIEVLKKIDTMRYRLRVGRKELSTKSHKTLDEGQIYWGNFFEGKGGVLTLSHLYKQPRLFQDDTYFLPITLEDFFENEPIQYETFKHFLLQILSDKTISKSLFQTYTTMLLALSKGIVHVPLLHEGKKVLVQLYHEASSIHFYLAFEHLGPLRGQLMANHITLTCLYESTFILLEKALRQHKSVTLALGLEKEIEPFFEGSDLVLDIKG